MNYKLVKSLKIWFKILQWDQLWFKKVHTKKKYHFMKINIKQILNLYVFKINIIIDADESKKVIYE